MSEPRFHESSLYGPVPLTSETIAWLSGLVGSILACSHAVSLIANELKAILDRKATSGLHRSKTTVFASTAVIFLKLPVYAACVASGAAAWPHGASPVAG